MRHVAPKKSLGQNFLVDRNIADKIVRLFEPEAGETVLEIGPGEGALTERLLEHDPQLLAVELDPEAADAIESRFGERLSLYRADFLKTDLTQIAAEHDAEKIRVIGNIPYYITSPILFHLIEHRKVIREAMLMMQREVAERLTATPRTKEYGILSVMAQTYSSPERLFNVPPGCFFPRPKVTSTVIRLRFDRDTDIEGIEEYHRRLVRGAFGKRRKTLNNSLTEVIPNGEERARIFEEAQIKPGARAEELTPEQFKRFARVFAAERTRQSG